MNDTNNIAAELLSPDRNVRARAVKRIAAHVSPEASDWMLLALKDQKRRVRETAVKYCAPFLGDARIADKLQAMVNDEDEKGKIRRRALTTLLGGNLEIVKSPQLHVAEDAVRALMVSETHRQAILCGLLQLDLSEKVESLLKSFVKEGSKEEAVLATKALCGFKVVNLGSVPESERSSVQSGERAFGGVFYWVSRRGLAV